MRAIIKTFSISILLLLSCGKKDDILKIPQKIAEFHKTNKPKISPINLHAFFQIDGDSCIFQDQDIESRLLSINYINIEKSPDEVILGYKIRFTGINKNLDIFFSRKFKVSSLNNNTSNLSPSLNYEEGNSWESYTPNKDEFLKIFEPRKLIVINQNHTTGNQDGFALFYNDFELVSYNPSSNQTNNINGASIIEIETIEHIKNNDIKQLDKPSDFGRTYANINREYYLLYVKFKLKLFNKEDSKTHQVEKGILKAIVYREK